MDYDEKRERLAERLRQELNLSRKVYEAIRKVPRHLFVPESYKNEAYVDTPLPIGYGQTISAPHMVAIMCELLDLREGDKVLEVGTGCGYHAAVTAEIVGKSGKVISIEYIPELAERARAILKALGYDNVEVIVGDGSKGYEKEAPYDKIYVTAAAPDIPKPLIEQLKPRGRMVIPVGDSVQWLIIVEKDESGNVRKKNWGSVRFVPLRGEYGFKSVRYD
ncbi:protein-L-isoaspartate O-methyltransferase [Archaeoglobus fulgidus]|uniref:Protein-L-isoaspartate O-methyltransferase 2 n=3 Tax=Archaeoglobus fulgidus TaxID=2234 RepID=PIMT2_ARCFU|nr:protein-L-isoaspartate O-methyltransferase [Archaeoglobus fulgidus]O27962.1 RecName: Full=Protein-L-isoaspartate O-methyltransferase 2; AltName: Full=L-isoaspartyl protein carboxyl methyltransferase 2; AltName: Full=Protein L-isoaspartyl methyltransferase 2; AltName: Full=Protein-beta-aspartate methyltransferase 2; Short=PIMT 2 [Archaeoglobus fulgidus DSM 4304]AAB88934.1 L-isoaspartyl protein carboxyl methyltransferase (pcm-2) [Archaeoglobus fulgidus DSM 4304]AIG99332.1 protein-L-isoaspartate